MAYVTEAEYEIQQIAKSAGFRPLNPWLYRQLKLAFGEVRVASGLVGVRLKGEFKNVEMLNQRSRKMELRPQWQRTQQGETYAVCCPICHDTRFRLNISYAYLSNLRDLASLKETKEDGSVIRGSFLVNCFNETACMSDYDSRKIVEDMVTKASGGMPSRIVCNPGHDVDPLKTVAEPPGVVVPIGRLADTHPTRDYILRIREMDADRLSRVWGVGSTERAFHYDFLKHAVTIPIVFDGKRVGWQCRRLEFTAKDKKRKWPPKYFTMPGLPKTRILCNYDYAKLFRTVSIVEGWFDIFGGCDGQAVCSLGSTLSEQQVELLRRGWPEGTIIWAYDPDVLVDPTKKARVEGQVLMLRRLFPRRFVQLILPTGVDPGSLTPPVYRQHAEAAAAEQKVKIDWRKR